MLHNNRKNGKIRGVLASALALALLAGIVTMQSCEREQQEVKPLDGAELSKLTKMPEYTHEGGVNQFLADNIKYPQEAKDKRIEGKVVVKFVIDEQGHVTDARVVSKNADPLLAQAAIEAVMKMPDWTPGEINGKGVPVCYMLPVSFRLDDERSAIANFYKMPVDAQYRIYTLLYEAVLKGKGIVPYRGAREDVAKYLEANKDEIHKEMELMHADPEQYKEQLAKVGEAHEIMKEHNKR